MFCKHCGEQVQNSTAQFCPKCGQKITNSTFETANQEETLASDTPVYNQPAFTSTGAGIDGSFGFQPQKKYAVLRLVSKLYKIAAVLVGILGFASFVTSCSQIGSSLGAMSGVIGGTALIGSLIIAVSLWAAGEGILVFLDIEENTRRMASRNFSE